MKTKQLPEDYALVLQQINEDGTDDFGDLAESLQYDLGHLAHIIDALYHKGLIVKDATTRHDVWLRLSHKGRRLVNYMWPESRVQFGY